MINYFREFYIKESIDTIRKINSRLQKDMIYLFLLLSFLLIFNNQQIKLYEAKIYLANMNSKIFINVIIVVLILSIISHINKLFYSVISLDKVLKNNISGDNNSTTNINITKSFIQSSQVLSDNFFVDLVIIGPDRIPQLRRIIILNIFIAILLSIYSNFIFQYVIEPLCTEYGFYAIFKITISILISIFIVIYFLYRQLYKKAVFGEHEDIRNELFQLTYMIFIVFEKCSKDLYDADILKTISKWKIIFNNEKYLNNINEDKSVLEKIKNVIDLFCSIHDKIQESCKNDLEKIKKSGGLMQGEIEAKVNKLYYDYNKTYDSLKSYYSLNTISNNRYLFLRYYSIFTDESNITYKKFFKCIIMHCAYKITDFRV